MSSALPSRGRLPGSLPRLQVEVDLHRLSGHADFFLFEENLRAVLLATSRQPGVAEACLQKPFPSLTGVTEAAREGTYPPAGLLPSRCKGNFACSQRAAWSRLSMGAMHLSLVCKMDCPFAQSLWAELCTRVQGLHQLCRATLLLVRGTIRMRPHAPGAVPTLLVPAAQH